MLITIIAFLALIMFDIIAYAYINVYGVAAVVVFLISMLLLFYSRDRMEKIVSFGLQGSVKMKTTMIVFYSLIGA